MATDPTDRPDAAATPGARRSWLGLTVAGIITATFFSDVGHEMCTAVLPLYLSGVGLGPAAIGWMEGIADLAQCVAKLGGGIAGHHLERKRPWTALGYLVTAVATSAIALARTGAAIVSLRAVAWAGRGFRSPLRDHLLADAVEATHYGRAYGLERAGDMLGALVGPVLALSLAAAGVSIQTIIIVTLVPGLLAATSVFFLVKERAAPPAAVPSASHGAARPRLPRAFWIFLVGVLLFGLGDFSRTLLIWLAADATGFDPAAGTAGLTIPVLLYAMHNLVSALAAYPAGHLGDRLPKRRILLVGYGIGAATNLLLAGAGGTLAGLVPAIVLSGVYIAVEETIEKAAAAEILPRHLRSLGFGVLASANALGDMASSVYVGALLEAGRPGLAFGIAAGFGAAGALWMARAPRRT